MTTEYVVFSYMSGRFAHFLAIHCMQHALNSLILDHAVLLIFTDQHRFSLSYNTSKGAEMGYVMLK